jgi:hypothetical protein
MLLHNMIHPLLAADFTQVAIALVVIFFTAMKVLFEANKPAAPKRGPVVPPQPPQDPRVPVPNAQRAGGQQADQLRSQVEEFLRRAGKMPPQPNQPQAPQQRPLTEIELLVGDQMRLSKPESSAEPVRAREKRQSPPVPPTDKRPPRRSVTPKRRVTLAERAADREAVRLSNLPEQPPHLGKRIIEEDEQFDIQLKAKFDHTVGTLSESSKKPQTADAAPAPTTPAAQIAALLANPEGVRQAIVLNEILRRPSDRW